MNSSIRYVVISPVRNEEDYVRLTLDSMIAQTIIPAEWILVDDGSTDGTATIVQEYVSHYPWIKMVSLADRGFYFPGTGVVNVFNQGYAAITSTDWDYLVKLDVDLSFTSDYFERVLTRMEQQRELGIASGWPELPLPGGWTREEVQPDHPVGPSKVYKRGAWRDMGGLLPVPGWDLADILAAQMAGWATIVFSDIALHHHRISGVRRSGLWSRKFLQGQFERGHGYLFVYTVAKALRAMVRDRSAAELFAKVAGFLYAGVKRQPYLFPNAMRLYLRAKQRKKLLGLVLGRQH